MTPESSKYVQNAFGATDPNSSELFKAVLVVIDYALQIEMAKVMAPSTTGEARVHSAGRLDALNEMLVHLQDRRDAALKPKTGQTEARQ
jgi:hypothetical protein